MCFGPSSKSHPSALQPRRNVCGHTLNAMLHCQGTCCGRACRQSVRLKAVAAHCPLRVHYAPTVQLNRVYRRGAAVSQGADLATAAEPSADTQHAEIDTVHSTHGAAALPVEAGQAVEEQAGAADGVARGTLADQEDVRGSAPASTGDKAEASGSGNATPYPGRQRRQPQQRTPPPYACAMTYLFRWPTPLSAFPRPPFLQQYPVPPGKLYNVNSFLGKKDIHQGQYLVTPQLRKRFTEAYCEALQQGHLMFYTENYHQQVFRYFVELDWDWDTDLDMVMEATAQLIPLIQEVAGAFYAHAGVPYCIQSVRTPYKVHLNFTDLLTNETLANLCRDRLLEECRRRLPSYNIDWERLIDFPHGSLRMMGSRKGAHMDRDPEWVQDKAYHPARLEAGRWRPGGSIAPGLLMRSSIFPTPAQVAEFESSPLYVEMIYTQYSAYTAKVEERRRQREQKWAAAGKAGGGGGGSNQGGGIHGVTPGLTSLPAGSSRNPLVVTLSVQEDDSVKLNLYIKSRFRKPANKSFTRGGAGAGSEGADRDLEEEEGATQASGGAAGSDAATALPPPSEASTGHAGGTS